MSTNEQFSLNNILKKDAWANDFTKASFMTIKVKVGIQHTKLKNSFSLKKEEIEEIEKNG